MSVGHFGQPDAAFDSVKTRLEPPSNRLRFWNQLHDPPGRCFVRAEQALCCRLQWASTVGPKHQSMGIDLWPTRWTPALYALTSPLLPTSSVPRCGQIRNGAIWLNADHAQRLRVLGSTLAQSAKTRCPPFSSSSNTNTMHARLNSKLEAPGRVKSLSKPRRFCDRNHRMFRMVRQQPSRLPRRSQRLF